MRGGDGCVAARQPWGERDSRTRTSIGLATAAAAGTSVIELPAGDVMVIDHEALTDRELAWSQTDFPSEAPARFEGDSYNEGGPCWSMRLNAVEPPKDQRGGESGCRSCSSGCRR